MFVFKLRSVLDKLHQFNIVIFKYHQDILLKTFIGSAHNYDRHILSDIMKVCKVQPFTHARLHN